LRAENHLSLDAGPEGGGTLSRLIREESGQGIVEYALIIAVIAIAVIVAVIFRRISCRNIFSQIGNELT
jgi:pilus assembly protein Flp/PilA